MDTIKILYCKQWFSYEASRLEQELKTNFEEIVIELEDGKTGQFTVFLMPKKFTIRWNGLVDYQNK